MLIQENREEHSCIFKGEAVLTHSLGASFSFGARTGDQKETVERKGKYH